MKKFLITSLICVFLTPPVFADWQTDFQSTYQDHGIAQAVADGLAEGGSLGAIIAEAQKINGLNMQDLLVAFFCADLNTNDIEKATMAANIPESILTAAYEQSLEECPQFIGIPGTSSDSHNITYHGTPPQKPGPPPVSQRPPKPPASSPNTF